jgi:peroxiredoxin
MKRGPLVAAFAVVLALTATVVALNLGKAPVVEVVSNAPNLFGVPRHPIKPEMVTKADSTAGSVLNDFVLNDSEGKPQHLASYYKDQPLLIVAVKDGCPCNIEAQPWFNQLYAQFHTKIGFLGIVDADEKAGKIFQDGTEQVYPMLVSPKSDQVFRALNTLQSVYVTLIGTDGKVIKQWPGYDQTRLKEMNALLAKESGLPELKWDVATAPEKPTSGCFFFAPIGTDPTEGKS